MFDVSQSLETCEVFLTFLPVHIPQSFLSHPLQHMTTETENKINIREKPCMKKKTTENTNDDRGQLFVNYFFSHLRPRQTMVEIIFHLIVFR